MADEYKKSSKLKTGKDAKCYEGMAGTPEIVDSRPDLNRHLETHLSSISTPELTNPTDADTESRGILPPEGKSGPMGVHPWKPKGRRG